MYLDGCHPLFECSGLKQVVMSKKYRISYLGIPKAREMRIESAGLK